MPCATTAVRSTSPSTVTSAALLLKVPTSMPSRSALMGFRSLVAQRAQCSGSKGVRYAHADSPPLVGSGNAFVLREGFDEDAQLQDPQRHEPDVLGDRP